MKLIRNLLIMAACVVGFSTQAASLTTVIASGGLSNLTATIGPAKVTQIIVTAPTTNIARVKFYDCPTNTILYTNASYTKIQSYLTNYITLYTNYFGATNAFTNYAMVDITNTVAASTNTYPLRLEAVAATNSASIYSGVDYQFVNGVWATNNAVGSATVTITYE